MQQSKNNQNTLFACWQQYCIFTQAKTTTTAIRLDQTTRKICVFPFFSVCLNFLFSVEKRHYIKSLSWSCLSTDIIAFILFIFHRKTLHLPIFLFLVAFLRQTLMFLIYDEDEIANKHKSKFVQEWWRFERVLLFRILSCHKFYDDYLPHQLVSGKTCTFLMKYEL